MNKILKRLYLGDVVKSFGTKQLRKLTTEKPQEDSIVGTWVFNDIIDFSIFDNISTVFNIVFSTEEHDYIELKCSYITALSTPHWRMYYTRYYSGTNTSSDTVYLETWESKGSGFGTAEAHQVYKTINITGGDDIANETFITWLKANATKQ